MQEMETQEMDISLEGCRVFVVEDESVITMLLQDMFEELNCEVVSLASRFQDALDKAKILSFEIAILDVNLNGQRTFPIAEALMARELPVPAEVSKFPPVRRDIALVVDQKIEVQALLDEFQKGLQDEPCRFVQRVALFDEFRAKSNTSGLGADEKSLAFRVTLQDTGGTLQDETVDAAIKSLVDRLARVYGARLRG